MSFKLKYTNRASGEYKTLKEAAEKAKKTREEYNKGKPKKQQKLKQSKQEGLFKQVRKALQNLGSNPTHPSLNTHKFTSMTNPFDPKKDVFEAYAQNHTPRGVRLLRYTGNHTSRGV